MYDLVTLDEAEEFVKAGGTAPAAQLARLGFFISVASRVVQFPELAGPVAYEERTKTFNGGRAAYNLPAAPATATAVTVDGSALDSSAWVADVDAGIVWAASGTFAAGTQNVVVTYTVGSTDPVPDEIKMACLEQVKFMWQNAVQGARRDLGGDVVEIRGYAVPNKVRDLCAGVHQSLGFA